MPVQDEVHPRSARLVSITAFAAENPAVEAINHLGIATLRQTSGNTLISPWSLQQSLAMVYAGARGKTSEEMAAAPGYKGDSLVLHQGLKELREAANAVASVSEGIKAPRAANRSFVDSKVTLKPEWLELTRKFYDATPEQTTLKKKK